MTILYLTVGQASLSVRLPIFTAINHVRNNNAIYLQIQTDIQY